MNINIVLGTEHDIDELEQLYHDLIDYLVAGINYPGWVKGVYPTRDNAIAGVESHTLYVAKHNGRITGSLILSHKPEAAYKNANWLFESDYSDVFVIHTFAVHPDYMKCGIGKALMDFAIQHSIESGVKSIRLDVYEGNLPAIHLYEKSGFQYIATVDLGYGHYGLPWFKLYEKLLS